MNKEMSDEKERNQEEKMLPENLEECHKLLSEYLEGWKRAKADYLNFKREVDSQAKELQSWSKKVFLFPLLDIADNFDKAWARVPDSLKNDPWLEGMESIKKQVHDYLKSHRVEELRALGEKFDPLKHEAVEAVEGGEAGIVAEELQKGYWVDGEILRPAKVKVYK